MVRTVYTGKPDRNVRLRFIPPAHQSVPSPLGQARGVS